MRGIASRLGVSATALYQHFESKASILRELRVYGGDLLWEALEPALTQKDPNARIKDFARRYVTFARTNPWLYTVLMEHEQLDWSSLNEDELKRSLRALQMVQQTLHEAKETGAFKKDVDPMTASFHLWAAVHGLCSLLINGRIDEQHPVIPVPDQSGLVEAFVDSLVDTFLG
jgi:AcrR family transcriptional regulator